MAGTSPTRKPTALVFVLAMLLVAAVTLALLVDPGGGTAQAKRVGALQLVTQGYRLTGPNETQRLTAQCPGRQVPFGGGMTSDPVPSADGEGAYPQSYERLGVNHGWHITAVLYDPSGGSTTPRDITVQVLCGRKLGHITPPHKTVHVSVGQTRHTVATCPGKRELIGGGFQRTDFTSNGGDYVTESRAISSRSWRVTGRAFGAYGGGLTAIGYCLRSRKPLVSTVSASTSIQPGHFGTAQTTPCPSGRRLIFGGFDIAPAGSGFFTNGTLNPDGSWSASAFAHPASPITLTAYGYCIAS